MRMALRRGLALHHKVNRFMSEPCGRIEGKGEFMYCGHCGKQIDGNAVFCPACGAKVLLEACAACIRRWPAATVAELSGRCAA